MARYALIKNGKVGNIIDMNENTDSEFKEKMASVYEVKLVGDDEYVGKGFEYDGQEYTAPAAEPVMPPAPDVLASLSAKLDKLSADVAAIKAATTVPK